MTDNEIIKALECCGVNHNCAGCSKEKESYGCYFVLCGGALDLINRQKAEIEELKKGFTADADFFASEYDSKIKSEAIKEFASKVNPIIEQLIEIMFDGNQNKCMIKNCHKHSSVPCESPTCIDENKAFWKLKIYDIVKEMTEGI